LKEIFYFYFWVILEILIYCFFTETWYFESHVEFIQTKFMALVGFFGFYWSLWVFLYWFFQFFYFTSTVMVVVLVFSISLRNVEAEIEKKKLKLNHESNLEHQYVFRYRLFCIKKDSFVYTIAQPSIFEQSFIVWRSGAMIREYKLYYFQIKYSDDWLT